MMSTDKTVKPLGIGNSGTAMSGCVGAGTPSSTCSDCIAPTVVHLAENVTSGEMEKTRKALWDRQEKQITDLVDLFNDKDRRHINAKIRSLVWTVGMTFRRLRQLESSKAAQPLIAEVPTDPTRLPQMPKPGMLPTLFRATSESTIADTDASEYTKDEDKLKRSGFTKRKERTPPSIEMEPKSRKTESRSTGAQMSDQTDASAGIQERRKMAKETEWQQRRGKRRGLNPSRSHRSRGGVRLGQTHLHIIRPGNKEKYSEILKRIKQDADAEKSAKCMDKIRKTATGNMLIVLTKENVDEAVSLNEAITNLLGEAATVISKTPEEDLEIKDLDDTTTNEDVYKSLQRAADDDFKTQTALVRVPM